MTKFIAHAGFLAAALALALGNYWFTYGLWPKSWWSFFGFGIGGLLLISARVVMDNEKNKV